MTRSNLSSQNITEGIIWKQLLSFFFPILLGTFFQQMYNTVDTIIVGRAVGTQALAAVGATSALINLVSGFFMGLSTGVTVIVSQTYGARDEEGVSRAVHTGMALSLVLGVIIILIGVLGGPWILRLTKTPESCYADAVLYTHIYFSGSVAFMVYNMGASILRALGDSTRPTIFLIIACLVNIIMDIVCVVWFKMGIAGAAIATVFSQCVSAVLVVITMMKQPDEAKLRLKDLKIHGRLLRRVLTIGIPGGLQFITFDLSNLLIQSSVNSFGETTIAAWTAYQKTDALSWMILNSFGIAATTFVGQNYGAQKYDRIRRSVWTCIGMNVAAVVVTSGIILLFRRQILGIYTTDLNVIETGAQVMMWIIPFNVTFCAVEVFAGAMRGTGYTIVPTIVNMLCVCVFRILWVWFVVSRWHILSVLSMAYPVSWILALIFFSIIYFRGKWLSKPIETGDAIYAD